MASSATSTAMNSMLSRKTTRWLIRLGFFCLTTPVVLQWIVAYWVDGDTRLLPPELQSAKNLLIVTAHPDDECLFFAPSILGVLGQQRREVRGSLLVMSTGNNYGLGETRRKELRGSCASLGIEASRCVALDHPELQDSPTVWWDTEIVQKLVRDHVRKWEADAIITFDAGGVSGHINHRAVSAAVSQYASRDARAPPTFLLTTTSLLRKYTWLGDLPLTAWPFAWRILEAMLVPSTSTTVSSTWFHDRAALVGNTWHRYRRTREAFGSHSSQYSWDRHLYLVLSRYVWFNDLIRVPGPAEQASASTE